MRPAIGVPFKLISCTEEKEIETAITVALIGLAGALFVSFANHRLTYWRDRNGRRIAASATFQREFCAVIEPMLRNNWTLQADQSIKAALVSQQQAVENFCVFLSWNRARFIRAWNEYKTFCEALNYAEYAASGLYLDTLKREGRSRAPDPRPHFIKFANRVLSYAKDT